jgi:hypothetical protein
MTTNDYNESWHGTRYGRWGLRQRAVVAAQWRAVGSGQGRCASTAWTGQGAHRHHAQVPKSAAHEPLDAGEPRHACTARYGSRLTWLGATSCACSRSSVFQRKLFQGSTVDHDFLTIL